MREQTEEQQQQEPSASRDYTPQGYREVRNVGEVWTNGREIIVLGTPSDVEDETAPEYHNCDAMGCGSLGWHVVAREQIAPRSA